MDGEFNSGRLVEEYLRIFREETIDIIIKEPIDTRKFMFFIGSLNKFI